MFVLVHNGLCSLCGWCILHYAGSVSVGTVTICACAQLSPLNLPAVMSSWQNIYQIQARNIWGTANLIQSLLTPNLISFLPIHVLTYPLCNFTSLAPAHLHHVSVAANLSVLCGTYLTFNECAAVNYPPVQQLIRGLG